MHGRIFALATALPAIACSNVALAAPIVELPTLPFAWIQAFLFGFALYAAGSWKYWLGALLMVFPVGVLVGIVRLHRDEAVSAAAIAENGEMYFPMLYAAGMLMLILGVVGIVRGFDAARAGNDGSS